MYALDAACKDLMVNGNAKTIFKNGRENDTAFAARLVFNQAQDETLRIDWMQVYIVSYLLMLLRQSVG